MDIKDIGKTIADLRKKHNMSQQDMAIKLNVSNKTISKWECGNGTPDIITLTNIAKLFNLTLDELVNYEQQSKPEEEKKVSSILEEKKQTTNKTPLIVSSVVISLLLLVSIGLILFFFVPRTPEITSSDIFDINSDSKTIMCTVDNEIDRFSFGNSIEVPRTNTWGVYYDLNGSMPINSQTVQLQSGNNTFYVIVENSIGQKQTYEAIIRRKPLYVVSYNTNGGQEIINEIVMEGNFATLQTPIKDGYVFDAWDFDFSTPITSNIKINASWIAKNLVITYCANDGTNSQSTQKATYDENVILKNTNEFIRTGYTLTSWNTNPDGSGTSYNVNQEFSNYNIPNDIRLYAQWTINQYEISINKNIDNAGVVNGTGSFDYGSTQTFTATTNPGYTWDGWYSKENTLQTTAQNLTITIGDENQEYIAKWTANKYKISLDVNGGNSATTSKEVVFGQTFILPVATRTEATFLGWFDATGKQYTNNLGASIVDWDIADNTTLYAHYKINEYQVSLSVNNEAGGSVQGSGLKEFGSEVIIIAQPKAGYSFVGWFCEGDLISNTITYSFEMPNHPKSFVAKWAANTYTISMDVNGGTALSEPAKDIKFDSSYSLPITNREGYTFAGWFLGANGTGKQLTDNVGNAIDVWDIADDTIVYAKWNIINYKVNYILNGGKNHNTNPSTYTIQDDDIILNYPTKTGYTFNGWVVSGATEAEKDMIISSGSIGEKTYAASWIRSSSFVAISTAEELQAIQNNPSGYYYLTKDIDLSSFDWSPIPEFNGILDGNGHSVVGLTFTSNDIVRMINWVQLALILENRGKIENLNITNATISLGSGNSSSYFAVLSVFNYGTIHNCFVDVNINTHGGKWGTIAYNNDVNGLISNCSSSGVLDGDEATGGGIVGFNEGIIKNSYSDMTLKAIANTAQKEILAGICATNGSPLAGTHATIENCFFTGTIENGYYQYGIAYNYGTQGSIKNCFVDATIGNSRDSHFGGSYTIGNIYDSLSIQNCYYSNSMTIPTNTEKTGTAIDDSSFNDKTFLKTILGLYEFINEFELWLDDSNVWVFTDEGYPKLYWEIQ